MKEPDALFTLGSSYTASGNEDIFCYFEGAWKNEDMPVLMWEVLRVWEAGVAVSAGIKANVRRSTLCRPSSQFGADKCSLISDESSIRQIPI
jgi:hypothetical protein